MVFPTAQGVQTHSGGLIPNVFSKKMLVYFYLMTVFGAIANTDYAGEIKNQGDKVTIRTLPEVASNEYVKGQGITYEDLKEGTVDLLIDKGLAWAFKTYDVDRAQADMKNYADQWAAHAAKKQAEKLDNLLLADIYGDADTANQGLTAGLKSGSISLGTADAALTLAYNTVIQKIIDCGTVLDEQSAPEDGRWIVLPPVLANLIKKSDLADASYSGDGVSMARNGRIGRVDNFTIFRSNQLTKNADGSFNCIFGQKSALCFASQLTKTETLRNQNEFGDLYRGLQVYGYKVVKPEAMGLLVAKA